MRIILNQNLPTQKERIFLAAMGIDLRNIENQYHNRHYYVETEDAAFTRRSEMTGVANTKVKTTISFHGVDVMTTEKSTLFGGGVSIFKLMKENVLHALYQGVAAGRSSEDLEFIKLKY